MAQRKVIYATISNEPVRSVTACLDEMLASSHGTVRAAFRRTHTASWSRAWQQTQINITGLPSKALRRTGLHARDEDASS